MARPGSPVMIEERDVSGENRARRTGVLADMRRIELFILGAAILAALVLVTAGCGGGSGY